jgi:hypothetical protein
VLAQVGDEEEPWLNWEELEDFWQLVDKLQLPAEVVRQVSQEVAAELGDPGVPPLEVLVQGFTRHCG